MLILVLGEGKVGGRGEGGKEWGGVCGGERGESGGGVPGWLVEESVFVQEDDSTAGAEEKLKKSIVENMEKKKKGEKK